MEQPTVVSVDRWSFCTGFSVVLTGTVHCTSLPFMPIQPIVCARLISRPGSAILTIL